MIPYSSLTADQCKAVDRLYEYDFTLLVAGMGSGKTVISLTAIFDQIGQGFLHRVLVIAPLKVCTSVWATECQKWEHLDGFAEDITVCTGSKAEREKSLKKSGKVVVVNFENVPWLIGQPEFAQFDGLVVDEITKLKAGGVTFKRLRKHIPQFIWRVGMSGTPVTENLQSLFYQAMIVDGGVTFGRNRQKFLERFFYALDYSGYRLEPKQDAERQCARMFAPYIHVVPDYTHTLPEMIIEPVMLNLPPNAMDIYAGMAKGMKAEGVLAKTAAIQTQKLQQIASGFMYDGDEVIEIHHEKIRAAQKLMDSRKSFEKIGKTVVAKNSKSNDGVLIVYQYQEELEQARRLWGDVPVIGGGVSSDDTGRIISDWNSGRLNMMLIHPKSAGHGLNLSAGGHTIIWLSPVWSRDLYDQTNARLWRRGQREQVTVYELVSAGTIDELIRERVDIKSGYMKRFIAHLSHF